MKSILTEEKLKKELTKEREILNAIKEKLFKQKQEKVKKVIKRLKNN